jgi:hypothetical protein
LSKRIRSRLGARITKAQMTIDVQIMFRGFEALPKREDGLKSTDLYLTHYSWVSGRRSCNPAQADGGAAGGVGMPERHLQA